MSRTPEYRVGLFGSGGVGKSALTIRFTTGIFTEDYDPTIEDYSRPWRSIKEGTNDIWFLDLLDTAGQEEFQSMRKQWMRECDGFLLVYDITSRITFEQVAIIRQEVLHSRQENDYSKIPIVVAGNKCDLENQRQVSKEEGIQYSQECGIPFFETSAKDRINHETCIYQCVREIRRIQKLGIDENSKHKQKTDTCGCLLL